MLNVGFLSVIKKFILLLLIVWPTSVLSQLLTISFDASPTENATNNITYTILKNGKVVQEGSKLLRYTLEGVSGDVFYARAVKFDPEIQVNLYSDVSNISIAPAEYKCDCKKKWIIAKNRNQLTRPMRNADFSNADRRIKIGAKCESKMIKPYSKNDSSRGYFFATNKDQFRGLVICKEDK